ncbi:Uncharacterised protein [Porphyromonas macacae]|uniref:Uncharacterized protein n=1 Tax=Porphyromonas macacae TaxID=28115 RepID=A0A379DHL9_9PORP|nr:Uncharacterised protein [Porphyromonas macacae]
MKKPRNKYNNVFLISNRFAIQFFIFMCDCLFISVFTDKVFGCFSSLFLMDNHSSVYLKRREKAYK